LTKLLVGLGEAEDGNDNDFEVIDLESRTNVCKNPIPFTLNVYGGIGGLGLDGRPLICGGTTNENCYLYDDDDDNWLQTFTMIQPRRQFSASSKSPYQNSSLMVTGVSLGGPANTAEILTPTGWIQKPSMPIDVMYHCMVTINTTTVMVIGGKSPYFSSLTFYFNVESETWTEGPMLNIGRAYHSCGLIQEARKNSIIVIGGIGNNEKILQSVEILDVGATEWYNGQDFVSGIRYAKLIEGISPKFRIS
jgi:hypothetical protein